MKTLQIRIEKKTRITGEVLYRLYLNGEHEMSFCTEIEAREAAEIVEKNFKNPISDEIILTKVVQK